MFKSKLILILLLGLSLTACMPNKDDVQMPVYSYGLVKIDSLGQASLMDMPAVDRWKLNLEWLADGRVLLVHDSLHIYDPHTQVLTDITPYGNYNLMNYPSTDLSPDGKWFYYSAYGKISRLNLNSYVSSTVAESDSARYVLPTLSRDGRYLCFLNSLDASNSSIHSGGFPYWMDLQTGIVTALSSGQANVDRAISYAWMSRGGDRLYYHSTENLMVMEPDGSGRSPVKDGLLCSWESHDGRFLLCREYRNDHFVEHSYRDNQSMTWYNLGLVGEVKLCRGSNILYHSSGSKLFKLDLETKIQTTLVSGSIFGKYISGMRPLAPSWDGKEIIFLVTFTSKIDWKYPL